jgi:hypothetical protein
VTRQLGKVTPGGNRALGNWGCQAGTPAERTTLPPTCFSLTHAKKVHLFLKKKKNYYIEIASKKTQKE